MLIKFNLLSQVFSRKFINIIITLAVNVRTQKLKYRNMNNIAADNCFGRGIYTLPYAKDHSHANFRIIAE